MPVMTDDRSKNDAKINTNDLEYKIEIATQTLDRNIGFIANCDNKTSIVLASFGVLLAIILTNEGLNEIFRIIKTCIEARNFCNILYLLCFAGSVFVMLFGMFKLGSVLVAKTSEKAIGRKDELSRIFFVGIRKSGDYEAYHQRFYTMSKEDLLDDLIEQIYINADIASTKYATYNLGLKRATVGFVLFISLLLIGLYLY